MNVFKHEGVDFLKNTALRISTDRCRFTYLTLDFWISLDDSRFYFGKAEGNKGKSQHQLK